MRDLAYELVEDDKEFTVPHTSEIETRLFEVFKLVEDDSGPTLDFSEGRYVFQLTQATFVHRVLEDLGINDTSLTPYLESEMITKGTRQLFLTDEQWKFQQEVLSKPNGLVQLPSGFGKNTMIVHTIISSQHLEGNVLVLEPSNALIQESSLRCTKYEVETCADFTSRVCIANPVALLNSHRLRNGNIVSWLSKVELILIDECQSCPPSLEHLLTQYVPQVKHIYGYSATADKFQGQELTDLEDLHTINYETFKVLKFVGEGLVVKAPIKKFNLIKTLVEFGDYTCMYSYQDCVQHVMTHPKILGYLIQCHNYHKGTILVPIINKDHATYAMERLPKTLQVYQWSSGYLFNNQGQSTNKDVVYKLKYLIKTGKIDILFGTSVSFMGVDFPELKGVVIVTGSKFGLLTQILGRTLRNETIPDVFLPLYKGNCPLLKSAEKKRLRVLYSYEPIVKEMV